MTDQRSSPTAIGTGSGLLIVAILSLLAIRSALRWLGNLPHWASTGSHTPLTRALGLVVLALGVLCLLGAAVLLWLRTRATRRTLSSRVSYLVLPSDDFDPPEDAVLRAAGQLSRVRRAVLGWLDTRASAVRLRLDSGLDGRMAYRVQVASRARSVVRSAFTSMGSVELREETAPTEEARA
jgi:hypothetical protein